MCTVRPNNLITDQNTIIRKQLINASRWRVKAGHTPLRGMSRHVNESGKWKKLTSEPSNAKICNDIIDQLIECLSSKTKFNDNYKTLLFVFRVDIESYKMWKTGKTTQGLKMSLLLRDFGAINGTHLQLCRCLSLQRKEKNKLLRCLTQLTGPLTSEKDSTCFTESLGIFKYIQKTHSS